MALGLNTGSSGGDFTPICKFDSRAGRMFRVDRFQNPDGSWSSNDTDVTQEFAAAFDFTSIQVGYAAFLATGPDFHMVPLGQPLPPRPTEHHKQAFRIKLWGPKVLGGLREFSSQAKCVLGAMDELHSAYEAAPEAKQGKIPVVKMTSTQPITTQGPQGKSTNYKPVFQVVQWIDRPAELGSGQAAAPATPAPKPATAHVPPPAPVAPPAAQSRAMADALNDDIPFSPFFD